MKLVLDCNVLVAAARKAGVCRAVVMEAIQHHEIVLSNAIREEYQSVAARPKHTTCRTAMEMLIGGIVKVATFVEPAPCPYSLPDPDDEVYLATALAGNAAVLVTGNRKDFPNTIYATVQIQSPREFRNNMSREP